MILPPSVTRTNKSLLIEHLKLINFRCFAELEIDFHEQLTVLVANNGQGKTAVLDAVATSLGSFVGAFDDGRDRGFDNDDIRLLRVGQTNRMEQADGGVRLEAKGRADYLPASWQRELTGPKSRTTRKGAHALTAFGKKLQSQVRQEADGHVASTCLPLVACYPTDRLWNNRRLPYKPLPRTSRMVGYTHCLESGSDFGLMADWFRYWSVNALNQRLKAQQEGVIASPSEFDNALEAVRDAINLCLKPSGWGQMDFNIEREKIVAYHPQFGQLPVAMLSDGIRSMLTLVADIAFRTAKLNPNLGPWAAKNTDGIVLIDEVDMHLHPAWQQTVLSSLMEAFPRIQFIVTTHSPQVLTSVPVECIRLLEQDRDEDSGELIASVRTFQQQTLGVASSTVLAEIMGTDPIPDVEYAHQLSQYKSLIEQGLYESLEAAQLKNSLNGHFGEVHPLMLECERLIRLQSFKATLRHDKKAKNPPEGKA